MVSRSAVAALAAALLPPTGLAQEKPEAPRTETADKDCGRILSVKWIKCVTGADDILIRPPAPISSGEPRVDPVPVTPEDNLRNSDPEKRSIQNPSGSFGLNSGGQIGGDAPWGDGPPWTSEQIETWMETGERPDGTIDDRSRDSDVIGGGFPEDKAEEPPVSRRRSAPDGSDPSP